MKVQIFGFGKMGRIHAKYLQMQGIKYSIYDPNYTGEWSKDRVDWEATHFIISSPIDKHYENYKFIRERNKTAPILVEKPYSLNEQEFEEMVNDDNLSVGMCLRFNGFLFDKNRTVGVIDFSDCVNPLQEKLIHYIDLIYHNYGELPIKVYNLVKREGSIIVRIGQHEIMLTKMPWKYRSFLYMDDNPAAVNNIYGPFSWDLQRAVSPILLEQIAFFNSQYIRSYLAHKALIKTIKRYGHITF